MSFSAMPTGDDLQARLIAVGLISNPSTTQERFYSLSDFSGSAVEEWNKRTGWRPYLKDTVDVTRLYDPPGPPQKQQFSGGYRGGGKILELDAGLITLTSLTVGVTATSTGTILTRGTDFWLRPTNAVTMSRPYEWVEFRAPQWGQVDSIQMIGRWGFWSSIPDDVWEAILEYSIALAAADISISIGKGLTGWKEADGTSETYGDDPFGKWIERGQKAFDRAVARHRRVEIGI